MFLTSGVKACTTPVLAWTSPRSRSQPSQSRLDQLRCSTPWLNLPSERWHTAALTKRNWRSGRAPLKQSAAKRRHDAKTSKINHQSGIATQLAPMQKIIYMLLKRMKSNIYLPMSTSPVHQSVSIGPGHQNFGEIRNLHMRYQALPQETMSPKRPNQRDSRPHGLNPRLLSVETDGGQCRYSVFLGPLVPTKWYVDLLTKKQSFQIT